MALDYYTHEKLAQCHIADYRAFAEEFHAFGLVEGQEEPPAGNGWLLPLLRSLATGHIRNLHTLQRL
jgi:hypothetical protein